MKDAITRLHALQPARWGAIVWAGPGYGTHLDRVARLACQRLLLLEPHPALHDRLARRLRGTPARIEPQALAAVAGTSDFHLMSDPTRSSLQAVEDVLQARPNLRCVGAIEVETLALADIVARHLPEGDEPNLLILDDTGMEAALLASPDPAALQAFSHLLVGTSAATAAVPTLDGFAAPQVFPSQARHGWQLHVRRRASAPVDHEAKARQQVEELEALVEALSGERDQLVREGRTAEDALAEALAARDRALAEATEAGEMAAAAQQRRVAELETALAAARQEAAAGTDRLQQRNAEIAQRQEANTQLRNRIAEVEAIVGKQQQRVAELQQAFEQRTGEKAQLEQAATGLRHRIAELEATGAAQQHRISESEATIARLQERLGELDNRLKEAAQTARLATRMQTVREQDLKDLQERYEATRQVQEHQHTLLVQVSDRLGAAASHFHRIANEGAAPAEPDEVVVFEQVRPAGESTRRKPGA